MDRCVLDTSVIIKSIFNPSKSLSDEVYKRDLIFDSAWGVAADTGSSGFDSYFIALARIKNASILTDDGGLHHHAVEIGVDSVLIRDTKLEDIKNFFVE